MPLKKIVSIFLLLNIIVLNAAFGQKYNAVDNIVLKYPKNFNSTEKLAERIQKDFTSEYDKARAIYCWIALNINYDMDAFLNPEKSKGFTYSTETEKEKKIQLLNEKTFQKAFKSKRAVCEGFSLLYAHIASLVGLKCQVITGDGKTSLNDIGRKNTISNHAWNTVQVDKKWILVDATWGQGAFDQNRGVFVKAFTSIYFDMKPKYFFAKHYPDSGIFLDHTINKNIFLNGPLIYDKTIEGDHEIIVPDSGIIEVNNGDKITFRIKNISKLENVFYLDKKNKPVKIENPKEKNGALEFQITYTQNLGKFITIFLYQNSIASFKITPKSK